jgi:hypothetical protein
MTTKDEKKRRAAIVRAIAEENKKIAIAAMPVSFNDLATLFDHLDIQLTNIGCDHSPRITIEFLNNRNLPTEKILSWFKEYGGYCDCEILANVEESWESEIEKHKK